MRAESPSIFRDLSWKIEGDTARRVLRVTFSRPRLFWESVKRDVFYYTKKIRANRGNPLFLKYSRVIGQERKQRVK